MLLFYKIEAELTEVELSSEHESFIWVEKDELKDLNERDDTYVEFGYLEALRLALE